MTLEINVNNRKFNMNEGTFKNNSYRKNISDAYVEYMWMDIVNNMIEGGRNGRQHTTSASVKNDKDMWGLSAQFVYRIYPSRKEIEFHNLKLDGSMRGHGILGKILDKVERVPGWTVSVQEIGNEHLGYYLGKKRGYHVFSGNKRVNLPKLASFLKNYPTNLMKIMERSRAMANAGVLPSHAILPPRA